MWRLFYLVCTLSPLLMHGQEMAPVSGKMIFLLGRDTTMAGTFSWQNHHFTIHVVNRPNVTVSKLTGRFFPNGELQSAEGYAYKPLPGKDSQLLTTYRLYVQNDSTFIEQRQQGRPATVSRFPGRGYIANNIGLAFRMLPVFWSLYAPQKTGDSLVSGHLVFGSNRKLVVKRIARNRVQAGSSVMGMITLHMDKKGTVRYLNAVGSSSNVRGFAVSRLDMDKLTGQFLQQEKDRTGLTAINSLDSVQTTLNGTTVKVVYSRPEMRGRKIFGSVVPWDRIWRTGANAATRVIIDRPIIIEGKELQAGAYSLWTLPSQKGWTIIFNSQAGIWGTEYNPQYDVLRARMEVEPLKKSVEVMTIMVNGAEAGGTIEISWEKLKASVPFSLR